MCTAVHVRCFYYHSPNRFPVGAYQCSIVCTYWKGLRIWRMRYLISDTTSWNMMKKEGRGES